MSYRGIWKKLLVCTQLFVRRFTGPDICVSKFLYLIVTGVLQLNILNLSVVGIQYLQVDYNCA